MAPECRNELVHRERRGQLSSSEELALDAHLEGCESCRLSRDVGADFDAEGELRADDGALLERLARRVTARGRATRPRRARAALLIAATFSLLVGAIASAKSLGWFAQRAEPAKAADATKNDASLSPLPARRGAPLVTPAAAPSVANATPPLAPELRVASATTKTEKPGSSALSAAQTFRKANDARRAGDSAQAVKLYRSLQREYPTSAEAALSSVSLGRLLQGQGSSAAALEQFNRYLTSVPGGPLSAEAFYGKARALAALGRVDEERQTWRELLRRFPSSPYRDSAQRRLGEMP